MPVIQTLQGVGVLIVGDERHSGVRYRIDISQTGNRLISARGVLTTAEAPLARGALIQAFTGGNADLELQTGETVHILGTDMSITASPPSFRFAVSGPLPGFPWEP